MQCERATISDETIKHLKAVRERDDIGATTHRGNPPQAEEGLVENTDDTT